MAISNWDSNQINDLSGKIAVITGSTSGIGKETARVLAAKNATVIMAIRNLEKGEKVVNEICEELPNANITAHKLDLTSLASVKSFADNFLQNHQQLDLLINNAGIMMCPYEITTDGFEIQMATNHLGHFALTGHLMPLLKSTPDARIVAVSSIAHGGGNIDFADIHWNHRKYKPTQAYADSKMANLYFMYELADKLKDDPNAPKITAAHPGWTKTELQRHSGLFSFLNNFFAQSIDQGALPTLRAATDPTALSGDYFGPSKFFEMRGDPIRVKSNALSHDKAAAKKLWKISERLTKVSYS